ncbi:MAG: 2-polyprenyl-6-methoxyphenol hydroxylase [Alphaproteobacteria bacterium HGW-Alphaproteobacteria-18]|nr:MAG: 2-polyprenyl-6-methoxyphenol hydroxylase [Alphaproteobacteria bacterium HGW-Alphaproteobacteria-18]
MSQVKPQFDVVIAGAGPVGLTMAIDLGRRGVRTLIVERNPSTGPWPKMDRSNSRTMEFYRRLGIADEVRALGYPADASMDIFIVRSLSEAPLLKQHYPSVATMRERIEAATDHSQPLEPYQLVSQNRLEPLLKSVAENTPNVTVRYGCELTALAQDAEAVTVTLKPSDGGQEEVRCSFLAGCDGGGSTVRKSLGIRLEGQGSLRKMKQICFRSETLYDRIPMGKGRHYYFTDPEGSAIIVQGDRKEFTLNSDIPDDTDLDEWIRRKIGPGIEFDYELLNVSNWTLHLLLAEKYREGRAFLAGDAAHLVIPTGGLGMNSGVGDALDLAWKLSGTVHGWGGPGLLESYEIERRPVGQKTVEASGWAAQGLGLWRANLTAAVDQDTEEGLDQQHRAAQLANRHHRRVHEMVGAEQNYTYAGSPLIASEADAETSWETVRYLPTTEPGARIPHIWLKDRAAMQDVLGADYTFVDLTGMADASAVKAAFDTIGAPLRILSRNEEHVRMVYGCRYLLVRPDLHIVWTGNSLPSDPQSLARLATGH